MHHWLVVWNIFYFSIQLGMSSSQLTFIFFRGVGQPATSNSGAATAAKIASEAAGVACGMALGVPMVRPETRPPVAGSENLKDPEKIWWKSMNFWK